MPNSALPENLKGKGHLDWPIGFRWVPRAWTAWNWGKPDMLFGNCGMDHPQPINYPGEWQVSWFPAAPWWSVWGFYFAFTTYGGTHFRIGARWDDVDDYVEWPETAIKRGIKL